LVKFSLPGVEGDGGQGKFILQKILAAAGPGQASFSLFSISVNTRISHKKQTAYAHAVSPPPSGGTA
jgi:hypothetical protein